MSKFVANQSNRRAFIKSGFTAASAIMLAPQILPSSVLGNEGSTPPSDRVVMGFIGLGHQGTGHLLGGAWTYFPNGYIGREDVQVVAVCDVWHNRRAYARERVNDYYSKKFNQPAYRSCEAYNDFRELLDRDEIDAVLIATPIHWHATMSILAAKAGKDVYCEKPTSVSIEESQIMVRVFNETGRVFQAGTQQRSEYEGKFRLACELIRNGRIGRLKEIYAYRDGGGVIWPTSSGDAQPVPKGFDWDLWLGPAPEIPYQGQHDAHLFGFGGINWGQHHYDIVQWALDADRTGPVEVFVDQDGAAYRYENGVVVYGRPYPGETISETGGAWFIGTEGKIGVDREHLVSDPPSIVKQPIGENDIQLYQSDSHSGNFLDCVKSRKPTICDVETAHRAVSVLLLGGIARQLNRSGVLRWDPVNETFLNDDEANRLMRLTKREPWKV